MTNPIDQIEENLKATSEIFFKKPPDDLFFKKEIVKGLDKICDQKWDFLNYLMTHYEEIANESAWIAKNNTRDLFGHFVNIYRSIRNDEINEKTIHDLNEMWSHLRRAITETTQQIIEKKLKNVKKKIEKVYWYRTLFSEIPSNTDIKFALDKVDTARIEARSQKSNNWKESIENYHKAYTLIDQLDNKFPSLGELKDKMKKNITFWATIVFGIIGIIGIVFSIISFFR